MVHQPQITITGELRKWQRKGHSVIVGKMYNDTKGIYFDGEDAVIQFIGWQEAPTYYLAVTNFSAVKCPKDEEIADASQSPTEGQP